MSISPMGFSTTSIVTTSTSNSQSSTIRSDLPEAIVSLIMDYIIVGPNLTFTQEDMPKSMLYKNRLITPVHAPKWLQKSLLSHFRHNTKEPGFGVDQQDYFFPNFVQINQTTDECRGVANFFGFPLTIFRPHLRFISYIDMRLPVHISDLSISKHRVIDHFICRLSVRFNACPPSLYLTKMEEAAKSCENVFIEAGVLRRISEENMEKARAEWIGEREKEYEALITIPMPTQKEYVDRELQKMNGEIEYLQSTEENVDYLCNYEIEEPENAKLISGGFEYVNPKNVRIRIQEVVTKKEEPKTQEIVSLETVGLTAYGERQNQAKSKKEEPKNFIIVSDDNPDMTLQNYLEYNDEGLPQIEGLDDFTSRLARMGADLPPDMR